MLNQAIKKTWQISTMPRSRKTVSTTVEQVKIFKQIVSVLAPYSELFDVREDTTNRYELWTRHAFRSLSMKPMNKRGVLFTGVLISKKHVGLYFYPLHINTAFASKIDESLHLYWKNNSVFHFKNALTQLTVEKLTELVGEGCQYYRDIKWID